jgi:hypothetical protein
MYTDAAGLTVGGAAGATAVRNRNGVVIIELIGTSQRSAIVALISGMDVRRRPGRSFVVTGIAVVAEDALGLRKKRLLAVAVQPDRFVAASRGRHEMSRRPAARPRGISRETTEEPLAACLLTMGRERTGTQPEEARRPPGRRPPGSRRGETSGGPRR